MMHTRRRTLISKALLATSHLRPAYNTRLIDEIWNAIASMDTLLQRLMQMEDPRSSQAGLAWQPRSSDVFIATYPKCGTTWVSFIAHCIRSGGYVDFEEIFQVVPWTKFALDCGIDLNAEQLGQPRLFKSHESYDLIQKNAKYIYVARDPKDACVSFYHFAVDWVHMTTDEVPIQDFLDRLFAGSGSNSGRIWEHYLSYYNVRNSGSVLWIFYEDLIEDLPKCVDAIAAFMGVPLDEKLKAKVVHYASFEYMKENSSKFDEHVVFDACKVRMGLDPDSQVIANKVNKGRKGANKTELNEGMRERLDQMWIEVFGAETGVMSYDELRSRVSILSK